MPETPVAPTRDWQQLVAAAVLGADRAGGAQTLLSGRVQAIVNFPDRTQSSVDSTARTEQDCPQSGESEPTPPVNRAVSTDDPAARMLRAAAVLSVYEQAGRRPAPTPVENLTPCEPDDVPPCSFAAGQHLSRILGGEFEVLLKEWCELAHRAGVRAPDEHLPALLDECAGGGPPEMAALIRPVLGRRGEWLGRLNPQWQRSADAGVEPRETWRVGEFQQRRRALHAMRKTSPELARTCVQETWEQEAPDDREWIVGTFLVGLSPADEPFLESALDDKRKPVRAAAADLLARLPESAYCRRMAERATACVTISGKKKLLGGRKLEFAVTLPENVDKLMTRDGLENKARDGMGNKAAVLCQIIAAAPLRVWEEQAAAPPEAIVAAGVGTDWKEPLIRGWMQAAMRQKSSSWAWALLDAFAADPDKLDASQVPSLIRSLENGQREKIAIKVLATRAGKFGNHPVLRVLRGCDHGWSEPLSREILKSLQRYFGTNEAVYDQSLRDLVVKDYAARLSPALAEAAATGWKQESEHWNKADQKMADALSATLAFRRAMIKELST